MKIISLLFAPITWVIKLLLKCAIMLALILLIVLACGNLWLPWVINWQVNSLSGFKTVIQSSRGSLFKGYVDLRELSIQNPKQFKEPAFISFNDLGTDMDLTSIFKNTIVLENIIIDIDNITLVKNVDGTYNYSMFIDNINKTIGKKSANNQDQKTQKETSTSAKNIQINKLVFSINSVKIIDESNGDIKEYSINYRREFSNISDPSTLVTPLVTDLSIYGLSSFIQSTFQSIGDLPGISHAKEGIIKVKDSSKEAVKGIKSGIKGLFSK